MRTIRETVRLVLPGVVALTSFPTATITLAILVFNDLWRRPDLTPRDRSLATIAALAAMGDDDRLDLYLRRGIESGLTRDQIAEAVTHLGFYAGWGKATAAMRAVTTAHPETGRALGVRRIDPVASSCRAESRRSESARWC